MTLRTNARPAPLVAGEEATREIISPDYAKRLLSQNPINRRVRPNWVSYLARQLREGNWHVTTDGVGIRSDGTLTNGQHRLLAIIEANMPAPMIVVRGVAAEAFLVIDRGIGRSLSDVSKLPNTLVADANMISMATGLIGRRSELEITDTATWWRPAHDALAQAIKGAFTFGFASASLRIGVGARWAIERNAADRQYVLDQFRALSKSEVPEMSTAGASLWKRWQRDKFGSGDKTHRFFGAAVAYYYMDPRRAAGSPLIKHAKQTARELSSVLEGLEAAFLNTPPNEPHPYAAYSWQPKIFAEEVRPKQTERERRSGVHLP